MKKLCSIALIFVLSASLLVGCGCSMVSTDPTTVPSSTQPTGSKPIATLPSGTNSTAPEDSTDPRDPSAPARMMPPARRTPRY